MLVPLAVGPVWGDGVRVLPSTRSLRYRIYSSGLQEPPQLQGICHCSVLKIATSVPAQANKKSSHRVESFIRH